ncbi:MAG: hypothetical protein U0525_03140 [Patescibacteria group bacterium]
MVREIETTYGKVTMDDKPSQPASVCGFRVKDTSITHQFCPLSKLGIAGFVEGGDNTANCQLPSVLTNPALKTKLYENHGEAGVARTVASFLRDSVANGTPITCTVFSHPNPSESTQKKENQS